MSITREECCVLNGGSGAWAFEPLAAQLSKLLGIAVSETPRRFNYLLHVENSACLTGLASFIPYAALQFASDKRLLAKVFLDNNVPTPRTRLVNNFEGVIEVMEEESPTEWCLKYPTSCGANGHRLITRESSEPPNWPRPFVVQEFIRLERPEVYRIYCVGGELKGWVARRFPEGAKASPWVAHARGARYVSLGEAPSAAKEAARQSLVATQLWDSFGCVDMMQKPTGEWVVLEVGTDGLFNHVDRDLGDPFLEDLLRLSIAHAFWVAASRL